MGKFIDATIQHDDDDVFFSFVRHGPTLFLFLARAELINFKYSFDNEIKRILNVKYTDISAIIHAFLLIQF